MDVPIGAIADIAGAFSGLSIVIETRWGPSPPITPNRWFVQASVSGPEQAKPAQSYILGLRAVSQACYRTFHGREVRAAGFVDDTEHCGTGAPALASIMRELSIGSIATGIGFALSKFAAFLTDWDKAVQSIGHPFLPTGIHVSGWDIWNGGVVHSVVPRAHLDTIEKLFGKRGTIGDRHSLAAADTISKIRGLRYRFASIRASWDEAAIMWQLIARGIVGYAPLVGTPAPMHLRSEDSAFLLSVLARLGTRSSVDRMSFTAPRGVGGLQLASVVECVVGAVASDLRFFSTGVPSPRSLHATRCERL